MPESRCGRMLVCPLRAGTHLPHTARVLVSKWFNPHVIKPHPRPPPAHLHVVPCIQVDASGPSEPEIELQNIGNGKFSVQLKVTKPGSYKVAVAWGDCAVPGSPFTIEIKAEESKE